MNNQDIQWNHFNVSSNPNIRWEYVDKETAPIPFMWNYFNVSMNPGIMIEDIIDNMHESVDNNNVHYINNTEVRYNWCWQGFNVNPNVTWDMVKYASDEEYYKNIPWNYYYLSKNPNITFDIIVDNPDKLWSIQNLSSNSMKYYDWDKVLSRQSQLYVLK